MSKSPTTTTSTVQSELPAYIEPHVTELLDRAGTVSNLPYQPYEDERLAEFSPDTEAAFGMVRDEAARGAPGIDQALTRTGELAGFEAQGIPDMDMQAYMNPYIQNVLDVQKQRATQTFGEQAGAREAAAVAAGAFGGDRRFVQESLAQRDLNQQMQEMEASGLAGAFDRATGLFQSDEESRRLAAQLGLDSARQLGGLEQVRGDIRSGQAEALSGVGAKTQQREQAGLDLAYQDFTSQRDYPAQQLSQYAQLISGTPATPQTTTSVSEPAPSFLSQLAGLATGGYGIYDLLTR